MEGAGHNSDPSLGRPSVVYNIKIISPCGASSKLIEEAMKCLRKTWKIFQNFYFFITNNHTLNKLEVMSDAGLLKEGI